IGAVITILGFIRYRIRKNEVFQKLVGSAFFVAIAVPNNHLIIIDYSKMNPRPFALEITLKHELCHLLLHRHLKARGLPKWLDEGACQWISDGFSEIIREPGQTIANAANLSRNAIRFDRLAARFPKDKPSMLLAYDQSKSLVNYIGDTFGKDKIPNILDYLKNGNDIESAVKKSLSITMNELEKKWRDHLKQKATLFSYLSVHVYGILFFIGAVITILGFIRYRIRKKNYLDDDENYLNMKH
ncbi:peptidase MA family metallohydrolase, partial [Thermodesulfobacteriota bacterium]